MKMMAVFLFKVVAPRQGVNVSISSECWMHQLDFENELFITLRS